MQSDLQLFCAHFGNHPQTQRQRFEPVTSDLKTRAKADLDSTQPLFPFLGRGMLSE